MFLYGKCRIGGRIAAVWTVAAGTRWERSWDLRAIAYSPPPRQWLRRLWWLLGARSRRARRTRIEREIAAYRERIAREGCTPEYLARVLAERAGTDGGRG